MSEWAPKRFWQAAEPVALPDGWSVTLDGREVRTPSKAPLLVPTQRLAEEIAAEWQAQEDVIDPRRMPFTRTANSAVDKVRPHHGAVADMLAEYGDADLLCYRADAPAELVARQAEHWDPMLDWAAQALDARLEPRVGVMHAPQDAASLARLRDRVHALDAHRLAAFHDLVTLSGSLILAFAAAREIGSPQALWALSRLDEIWQAEQWGIDEEAERAAQIKCEAFAHAMRYFRLCGAA